jgi:hypothetical protein
VGGERQMIGDQADRASRREILRLASDLEQRPRLFVGQGT